MSIHRLNLTPADLRRWRRAFAAYQALDFAAVEPVPHDEAVRTIERYLETLGDIFVTYGVPAHADARVSAATGDIEVDEE